MATTARAAVFFGPGKPFEILNLFKPELQLLAQRKALNQFLHSVQPRANRHLIEQRIRAIGDDVGALRSFLADFGRWS